jgi:hypothetical protein
MSVTPCRFKSTTSFAFMSWQRTAASFAADAGSRAGVSVDNEVAMRLREMDQGF